MSSRKWFFTIISCGLLARCAVAFTGMRAMHPDEFHQTVEFAHFFQFGFMTYAQEVVGHFRNLSFPALLALPYQWGHYLFDGAPHARIFTVKIFMTIANLGILWGSLRVMHQIGIRNSRWAAVWTAFYFSAYFFIEEAGRTSIEHGAAICLWLALGLLTLRGRLAWWVAGILLVGTGITKYPAGLLGVGALLALTLTWSTRPRSLNLSLWGGIVTGLVFGGLADLMVYGRPYESLWMYTQYNVLTGAAELQFGANSAVEYLHYFNDRLSVLLFVVTPLALYGMWHGIRNKQPWVFALILYVIGHLIPAHKEPRFMAPVFHLFLLAGFYGLHHLYPGTLQIWQERWRKSFYAIAVILLLVNGIKVAELLRGELWKPRIDFMRLSEYAERTGACAFVTVHRPLAFQRRSTTISALPPVATLPVGREWQPTDQQRDIMWFDQPANCSSQEKVVLHLHQTDPFWLASGCRQIVAADDWYSRLGHYVDETSSRFRGLYSCPAKTLAYFRDGIGPPLVTRIPRLVSLPPPGIDSSEFMNYVAPGNFQMNQTD